MRSYRARQGKGRFCYDQILGAVWSWKEWIKKIIILGGYLDDTSFSGREFDSKTSGEVQT